MRIAVTSALAILSILFLIGSNQAFAAKNPFEIKSDKQPKGVVIIALDEKPMVLPGAWAVDPDFRVDVESFDLAQKKPVWVSSANVANFHAATDAEGYRYLVGAINEGEAFIVSYRAKTYWPICYNTETYHFYIKAGTYNFIGRFEEASSRSKILRAVAEGKMPVAAPKNRYSYIPPLVDEKLEGFISANSLPDEKLRLEALASKMLGHAVDIIIPTLTPTNFSLSNSYHGKTTCD